MLRVNKIPGIERGCCDYSVPASFMSYAHFIIRNSTVVIERNRNNGLDPSVQSVRTHRKKNLLERPALEVVWEEEESPRVEFIAPRAARKKSVSSRARRGAFSSLWPSFSSAQQKVYMHLLQSWGGGRGRKMKRFFVRERGSQDPSWVVKEASPACHLLTHAEREREPQGPWGLPIGGEGELLSPFSRESRLLKPVLSWLWHG